MGGVFCVFSEIPEGIRFFLWSMRDQCFFLTTTNPFWGVPPFRTNPSTHLDPSHPHLGTTLPTERILTAAQASRKRWDGKVHDLQSSSTWPSRKNMEKTPGVHFKKNNRRGFKTHLVFGKVSEFLICLCILEFKVSVAPWKVQRGLHYRKSELVFRLDSKKNDKCVCVCHYNLQDSPRKWTSSLHHTTSPSYPGCPSPKTPASRFSQTSAANCWDSPSPPARGLVGPIAKAPWLPEPRKAEKLPQTETILDSRDHSCL